MKIEEPKLMRELRKTREIFYEETKDMTPEERSALIKIKSERLEERMGIKLPRVEKKRDGVKT
jgi:hypothetical protein